MGTLRDLLDGEALLVRYYISTGGYEETQFDLSGLMPVAEEALGIVAKPDPAEVTKAKRQSEIMTYLTDEMQKCIGGLKGRKRQKCLERTQRCMRSVIDDWTLEDAKRCAVPK